MAAEAERKTENLPEWKRIEVDALTEMIDSYESVGIVSITGIPSRQLQNMRNGLHGTAQLRVSRNTLVERALEAAEDDLQGLIVHVHGQIGIVGTDANPFALYRELEASKTPAPINEGEVAPNDIVIPAGDTGIDPGPFVGELQQVGAKAQIKEGSIHVTADSTVLEEGEVVSAQLANVLSELEIEPKEVGLDLRGVYSEGTIFAPEDLDLDLEAYEADIKAAVTGARNLSINAVYPTEATAPALITKALGEAKSLGLAAAIESPDLAGDLVSKADAQVRALAARIDDEEALPEELRGLDTETETEEETPDEDDEPDAEAEADDEDDDDDDEGDGAEGLGAMFG